ncbi:MAG: DegV family protein [Clostridiales bacterium]|nr:DegV family protein [Clostridiales bacterium]
MRPYVITTDSSADLTQEYLQANEVGMVSLNCLMDGEVYNTENPLPVEEFYEKIRQGSMPTTSQVNPDQAKALFEPYIKEGRDVLHLAFSSALSGTCQSAVIAANELMEEYPDSRIIVVDTLTAAMGQGLLVHKAVQMKNAGVSLEEAAAWCEENKLHVAAYVTVDDLFHLHRGGRVSKSTAILGSLAGIKPLLRIDNEGKLEVIGKVRGRKKAVQTIIENLMESLSDGETTVFISHGDCLAEAEAIRKHLEETYGIKETMINFVGPVVGAHTGAGVLAVFALCKSR